MQQGAYFDLWSRAKQLNPLAQVVNRDRLFQLRTLRPFANDDAAKRDTSRRELGQRQQQHVETLDRIQSPDREQQVGFAAIAPERETGQVDTAMHDMQALARKWRDRLAEVVDVVLRNGDWQGRPGQLGFQQLIVDENIVGVAGEAVRLASQFCQCQCDRGRIRCPVRMNEVRIETKDGIKVLDATQQGEHRFQQHQWLLPESAQQHAEQAQHDERVMQFNDTDSPASAGHRLRMPDPIQQLRRIRLHHRLTGALERNDAHINAERNQGGYLAHDEGFRPARKQRHHIQHALGHGRHHGERFGVAIDDDHRCASRSRMKSNSACAAYRFMRANNAAMRKGRKRCHWGCANAMAAMIQPSNCKASSKANQADSATTTILASSAITNNHGDARRNHLCPHKRQPKGCATGHSRDGFFAINWKLPARVRRLRKASWVGSLEAMSQAIASPQNRMRRPDFAMASGNQTSSRMMPSGIVGTAWRRAAQIAPVTPTTEPLADSLRRMNFS